MLLRALFSGFSECKTAVGLLGPATHDGHDAARGAFFILVLARHRRKLHPSLCHLFNCNIYTYNRSVLELLMASAAGQRWRQLGW